MQVRKEGITDIQTSVGRSELQTRFVELRAKGYSYARIADQLHVSKGTMTAWSRELEGDIATLKALELESLQEEYYLLKEGRIRLLGGLLRRLMVEAESRDLSDVPTDKVLDLILRTYKELQLERVEVRPLEEEVQRSKTGPKLNSIETVGALEETLRRYQTGLIDETQARTELSLCLGLLRGQEQAVMEDKLDRILAVLSRRD